MTFLHEEVESEEMILLARTGLGFMQRQKKKAIVEESSLATSAALVNTKGKRSENVTETEIETDAYYLPHRDVFKYSEITKIRPAFDATAREGNNPSFSDCLLRGLNLTELIPDILDRFCMYAIGLSADIEKAFLQICVTPEHRDFLRSRGKRRSRATLTGKCLTTLLPKIWLQETWKLKLAWDSPLSFGLCNKIDKWFKEILLLQNVEIPRYYEMNSDSDLHVFVYASRNVYAACIFVRTKLASEIKLHLLRAKARVTPTKSVTMPRLELLACFVGARLANSIKNSLDILNLKITYWSDSLVALHWIKNNEEWSIFVSNRIKEITKISSPENWRHVPGRMDPADVLSRGCSPRYLLESKWFEGPEWLLEDAITWPTNELQYEAKVLNCERRKIKLLMRR
ncbi:integrase catalytic domain-containing protein [Trichonephila clavipes]|nr:integrase catalytic domain-containing protein [Trichonephila clavipes]